jgi:uncharacterized protein YggU (UPF0235/DUF167 family)
MVSLMFPVMMVLQIKVKPNARESVLEQAADGTWMARLKSAPVDGRANQELMALVARHWGCPKSAVSLKTGASGRLKLVRIELPDTGQKPA